MEQTSDITLASQKPDTYDLAMFRSRPYLFAAFYLLIILAAAVMRLSGLGNIPLSPAEAQEAIASWQFLQAGSPTIDIGSPAYFSLTSILSAFFGSSDVIARLVPALFGLGLIVLPSFLRRPLGPLTALTSALLFTVSPLFALTSRTVGGDAIALFALLLTTIAAISLTTSPTPNWFYALAAALAIGITSAPLFYSGLLTLVIAWWVLQKIGLEQAIRPSLDRDTQIKGLILGIVLLLALSTRFFTYLPGLSATARLFGEWITQFSFQGDFLELLNPILALIRYEVILFPLGIFAILWALWGNWQRGSLFTYWLLASLIFILLQRGIMSNALVIPIPGYLLLGMATSRLLGARMPRPAFLLAGIYMLLGGVIFVNLSRIVRQIGLDDDLLRLIFVEPFNLNANLPIGNLWVIIFTLIAIIFITYTFLYMGAKVIVQAAWLAILVLILIFQWGTAWQLTHYSANDPRERWVNNATDDEVPVLIDTMEEISNRATNSRNGLSVLSGIDSPVLRWYLRDYRQAQIGESLTPGLQYDIVISHEDSESPSFASDYFGSDFGLIRREPPSPTLSSNPIVDTVRWWLFFDSPERFVEDRLILWVRADLTQP